MSLESFNFLVYFKPKLEQFKDFITFSPKYKFQNLAKIYNTEFLQNHCYSKGRFCEDDEEGFNPFSVLEEGIRQICIWDLSQSETQLYHSIWWNYIDAFRICFSEKKNQRNFTEISCFK